MPRRSMNALIVVLSTGILAACQVPGFRAAPAEHTARAELTTLVTDLRMHLADDTYRAPRARTESGQIVFENLLWRIDRLAQLRAGAPADADVNVVLLYSRGRALERLRRYEEALDAFRSVSSGSSRLASHAAEAAIVMERFATAGEVEPTPDEPSPDVPELDERGRVELRVAAWRTLAAEYAGSAYAPLAREEAEAWDMVLVSLIAQRESPGAAIAACKALVERHRTSKLRAQHLIRLGDVYADAARSEYVGSSASRSPFDVAQYDVFMERAFAAYELAREARRPTSRHEAATRIEALLAYHEGVRARVR